jgi:phage terminase small subunit
MKLTPKQQAFADYYIQSGNATEAAIKAGYSEKTAKQIATENLSKPYLASYIKEKREKLSQKTEWTIERLINEFAMNHTRATEKEDTRASNDSMKEIGKLLGYYKDKVEHSGEIKMPTIIIE